MPHVLECLELLTTSPVAVIGMCVSAHDALCLLTQYLLSDGVAAPWLAALVGLFIDVAHHKTQFSIPSVRCNTHLLVLTSRSASQGLGTRVEIGKTT